MSTAPVFAALVAAAGAGLRLGEEQPKQFLRLDGLSLLQRVCLAVDQASGVGAIIILCPPGLVRQVEVEHIAPLDLTRPVYVVEGGSTRQRSVRNGVLQARRLGFEWLVIHDAARPFASSRLFEQVMEQAVSHGAALAAWPSSDTVKMLTPEGVSTLPREQVWLAQTPQAFRRDWLEEALAGTGIDASDEAQLLEGMGHKPQLVAAPRDNFKVTTPDDWRLARHLSRLPRMGQGFDVHRLVPERPLVLAGLQIEFPLGLLGHSDADVLTHALMDALLAAAALGDIGRHFPDSDEQWKGASSLALLKEVRNMLAGYMIVQVSAVLMAEKPKIAPYAPAMRANWAAALGLPCNRINIAATTSEGLGFVGRGQGMAAQALAVICEQ